MVMLTREKRQLCDIQGRLFELAWQNGYDSVAFMQAFMNSKAAASLDDVYDRLQWAGEEYILEELEDEVGGLQKSDVIFDREVMYWAGYTYRYWHFYTQESSKEIYAAADADMMNACWLGFHTLDVEMAIDDLKEIHALRMKKK